MSKLVNFMQQFIRLFLTVVKTNNLLLLSYQSVNVRLSFFYALDAILVYNKVIEM